MIFLLFSISLPLIFVGCKSVQNKKNKITNKVVTKEEKEGLIKQGKTQTFAIIDQEEFSKIVNDGHFINDESSKLLAEKPKPQEVFRTVVSTNGFDKIQIANESSIRIKADPTGDTYIIQELKKFDKVNYIAKAIIKIDLYPDSGLISRVRFKKPTGISELDKIISEDITRWVFEFPKKVIHPRVFIITYNIVLHNKITRDEALKILKKKIED